VKKYVSWGAGPRASQYLVLGAKARAGITTDKVIAIDKRP
jgi:MoxR-like ATPase